MNPYWQELVKSLGGFAILASALAWLTRTTISHFLSKDIETLKGHLSGDLEELKHQLEMQRDSFNAHLQVLATEHATRFGKLHEKRVEILAKLHYLLETARASMSFLKAVCETGPEAVGAVIDVAAVTQLTKEASERNRKAFDFFQRNKLYFSSQLSQQIQTLVFALSSSAFDLVVSTVGGHPPEEINKRRREFIENWEKEDSRFSAVMQSVEAEFRKILASDTGPDSED